MLQEVNLVDELPLPQPLKLTLPRVAGAAVAFAIILIVYFFLFMHNSVRKMRDDTFSLTQQSQAVQTQLMQLQKKLDALPNETELPKILAALQDKIKNQQALLDETSTLTNKTATKFSAIFTALAEVNVSGLWLEHILISTHALSLSGVTYREKTVSDYLSLLTQKPTMKPYHFQVFNTKEIDSKTTGFTLSTEKADEHDDAPQK